MLAWNDRTLKAVNYIYPSWLKYFDGKMAIVNKGQTDSAGSDRGSLLRALVSPAVGKPLVVVKDNGRSLTPEELRDTGIWKLIRCDVTLSGEKIDVVYKGDDCYNCSIQGGGLVASSDFGAEKTAADAIIGLYTLLTLPL
jgi:hypothetical protein